MEQQLEPTYLRYIYDGLVKGSIHPENAAELPDGLIGMYEEAFDERTSVIERQKLLQRFAIWALLKKEVRAAFVAEILGETEDDIQDFISTYSAWFNSPESGKYQLYHERLKVYLLQKLSEGEVAELNSKIVELLLQKINDEYQSESVLYCFEHLSFHLFLNGYLTGESALLAQFCLDDNFKKRQFELSGYYEWEEKMMALGVEYFSLKQDPLCHQVVFEKTKIQFKKKDIDLILSLIRRSEFNIVLNFFKNTNETDLIERLKLAYFYILAFHEIFEHQELDFEEKKTQSAVLFDVFRECFKWEREHVFLSQYINFDISFRLFCYMEEYGLDITKYSYFSMADDCDHIFLNPNSAYGENHDKFNDDLRFFDLNHKHQAKLIIDKLDDEWNVSKNVDEYVTGARAIYFSNYMISDKSMKIVNLSSIHKLYSDVLPCISQDVESYNEMLGLVKYALKKMDISWTLKKGIFLEFERAFDDETLSVYQVNGYLKPSDEDGKLLKIQKTPEIDKNKVIYTKKVLSDDLLSEKYFISIKSKQRYDIVSKIDFSEEFEMELLLAYLDLNIFYSKIKEKDIYDLCAALSIEFYLDTDSNLIEDYQNELIDYLWGCEHQTDFFENDIFTVLIEFLNQDEINGHIRNTLSVLKDTLMDIYFDFRYYEYSFAFGVSMINLYSKNKIPFSETEIFKRVIEDLNELIEEDDYEILWSIANCSIDNLIDKDYCDVFFKVIGQIKYEDVRESFLDNITKGIMATKGLNFNTILFIQQTMTEFPRMHLNALDKLSEEASKLDNFLSYYLLRSENKLLLKRLLLNVVSKIENLSDPFNQQILRSYNLNWVHRLYNDYIEISNNPN
jgi:hypothetical protein